MIKVNILGMEYSVIYSTKNKYPVLKKADGVTDTSTKKIIVNKLKKEQTKRDSLEDLRLYRNKVTRHEVIHAFLYESGLSVNSGCVDGWASNEEMVDWMAIQFPKIYEVFKELGIEEV